MYAAVGGPHTLSFARGANLTIINAGNLSAVSTNWYTLHFICENDTIMYEVGRTAALS